LDTPEIIAGVKSKLGGKAAGGSLQGFGQWQAKKEAIIYPVLKIGRHYRWAIKKEYIAPIEKILKEVEPYLK
jgi:hypothetical protein